MYHLVEIVVGSESDLDAVKKSAMIQTMEDAGLSVGLSVISAHRNPKELEQFCERKLSDDVGCYIGVAGMAAALPGAIAACTRQYAMVIGVPLDEHGIDSCLYMPPGVPVALAGVGSAGLKNAALLAMQVILGPGPTFQVKMNELRASKPAQLDIYQTETGWKTGENA